MRIALIFGGRSSEHEVSLHSAASIRTALTAAGHEVVDIGITRTGQWLVGENVALMLDEPAGTPWPSGLSHLPERLRGIPQILAPGLGGPDSGLPHLPDRPSRAALGQVDVVFPMLHGPNGEDGALQGLLEMANVPYVGCGVLSSALAMDKTVAKRLLAAAGIRQTPYLHFHAPDLVPAYLDAVVARIEARLSYPLFVKPANMGSSVGISRATDAQTLVAGLQTACAYDEKVLVEKAVPKARELEVSVLGWHEPEASVVGEVVSGREFYDYEAKYHAADTQLLIPAPIPEALGHTLQHLAIQAFRLLEGCGMGRVDFLVEADTHKVFLSEVNTIPGFTATSMYPKMWEASGLSYGDLLQRLIHIARERHARKQQLKTTH